MLGITRDVELRACTHKIAIGDSDLINVRFGPLCGLKSGIWRGPRSAKSGLVHRSKDCLWPSSSTGTSMPRIASQHSPRHQSSLETTSHNGALWSVQPRFIMHPFRFISHVALPTPPTSVNNSRRLMLLLSLFSSSRWTQRILI